MNTSDEKAALREQYRRLRLENKENVSFNKVLDIPEIASSKIIASYFSYGSEPKTNEINKKLIALGIRVLLPRINGEELEWRFWDGNLASVEKINGIYEPTGELFTDLSHIDSVILPALAIDHTGNRLGKVRASTIAHSLLLVLSRLHLFIQMSIYLHCYQVTHLISKSKLL